MNVHDQPVPVLSRLLKEARSPQHRWAYRYQSNPMHVSPLVQVTEFHRTFNVATSVPISDELTAALRLALIEEELDELRKALAAGDVVAVADALADLAYVVYGSAATWGIDLDLAMTAVHESNMTKLGADSQPIKRADGKIMKGPDYRAPDLTAAVAGCPPLIVSSSTATG